MYPSTLSSESNNQSINQSHKTVIAKRDPASQVEESFSLSMLSLHQNEFHLILHPIPSLKSTSRSFWRGRDKERERERREIDKTTCCGVGQSAQLVVCVCVCVCVCDRLARSHRERCTCCVRASDGVIGNTRLSSESEEFVTCACFVRQSFWRLWQFRLCDWVRGGGGGGSTRKACVCVIVLCVCVCVCVCVCGSSFIRKYFSQHISIKSTQTCYMYSFMAIVKRRIRLTSKYCNMHKIMCTFCYV